MSARTITAAAPVSLLVRSLATAAIVYLVVLRDRGLS